MIGRGSLETGVIKMSQTEQTDTARCYQVEDQPKDAETRNDPAFEIVEVNLATGETIVVIQKGIIGALANQLKNTSNRRKGSSILRKLGYVLSECGDLQYSGNTEETDLDPEIIKNKSED